MKAMRATKWHFGVKVNLTSSAKWLRNQMYCSMLSFKKWLAFTLSFMKRSSSAMKEFCHLVAAFSHVGMSLTLIGFLPSHQCQSRCQMPDLTCVAFELAGWDHGFSWLVNMETTRLLNFSLTPRSLYASLSKAQTSAVFFDLSCFLAPGGKAQAWRTDPAILAVTPKSKVCSTSKHTLYSGKPPGIVKRVCLVQGLSFKPSKDFRAHPGSVAKSYGFLVGSFLLQSHSQQNL